LALNTFDLHGIITSLEESLLSKEGGVVALLLSDISSRNFLTSILIKKAQHANVEVKHLETVDDVHASLNELSLFSSKTLYIASGFSLSNETLVEPPAGSSLLLSLESKGQLPKNGKEYNTIVFPSEKPWDQKARIIAWTKVLFQMRKKVAAEELVHSLCATCDNDFMRISSEVEKISLFMGNETHISLQKAAQVSTFTHSEKEWNIAENIVWNGEGHTLPTDDHTEFFRFIGLLRYHLQLGLALTHARDQKALIQERYPKIMKKADKVYLPRVKTLGKEYFIKGNVALAELERNVRTASHATRHYWDTFIINMRCHI